MVLTQSGQWVPVQSLYSLDPAEAANGGSGPTSTTIGGPSLARKWAMGFLWIVLAGWLGMGTLFALLHEVLSALFGVPLRTFQYVADVLGIGLGIWWHVSWLAKARARTHR